MKRLFILALLAIMFVPEQADAQFFRRRANVQVNIGGGLGVGRSAFFGGGFRSRTVVRSRGFAVAPAAVYAPAAFVRQRSFSNYYVPQQQFFQQSYYVPPVQTFQQFQYIPPQQFQFQQSHCVPQAAPGYAPGGCGAAATLQFQRGFYGY